MKGVTKVNEEQKKKLPRGVTNADPHNWKNWARQHNALVVLTISILVAVGVWAIGLALSFSPNEIGAFMSVVAIILSLLTLAV